MKTKRPTRGEAIRAFCVECMGGDARLPRDCTVTRCALWIYRNGVEEAVAALDAASLAGSRAANVAISDGARAA